MASSRTEIQRIVEELLRKAGVKTPPVPVDRIAESLGAELRSDDFEGDLSGFLYRQHDRAIIGVNKRHAVTRRRFTIAHELGHLILHDRQEIHVDRRFWIHRRDGRSSQAIDPEEIAANQFAAELLMPAMFLRPELESQQIDIEDDEELSRLSRRYAVSLQAMIFRLTNLGLLPA